MNFLDTLKEGPQQVEDETTHKDLPALTASFLDSLEVADPDSVPVKGMPSVQSKGWFRASTQEGHIQGRVAEPGTLFVVDNTRDRSNDPMVVLKVPISVNRRLEEPKKFTIAIWGKERTIEFLRNAPVGSMVSARGPVIFPDEDNRRNFYIQVKEMVFGVRPLHVSQSPYYIYNPETSQKILKSMPIDDGGAP